MPNHIHIVALHEQISEIKRELAMRERLYPTWIERGTLRQQVGCAQIARLRATLDLLCEIDGGLNSLAALRGLDRNREEEGLPI